MTTRQNTRTMTHHPDIERWRNAVNLFWMELDRQDEVDYALTVMWGESQGNPQATRPFLNGAGLYQHAIETWDSRARAAQKYWNRRGIDIGTNIEEPLANIAVAAWLRQVSGWGNFPAAMTYYPEGSVDPTSTTWDGYTYQDLVGETGFTPMAPRGDGQGGDSGANVYSWVRPVSQAASDPTGEGLFGASRDDGARSHGGLDFGGKVGEPIYATADGLVKEVGWLDELAGFGVRIDHGGGWVSNYLHQPEDGWTVKAGQQVNVGQQIGTIGQTGNAESAHLHFSLLHDGRPYDPTAMGILSRKWEDVDFGPAAVPHALTRQPQEGAQTRGGRAAQVFGMALDTISTDIAGGLRVPLVPGDGGGGGASVPGTTAIDDPSVIEDDEPVKRTLFGRIGGR